MPDSTDQPDALRAELAALRAELALYRRAFDHMSQGLGLFDREGRIALCNRRYAEVLGPPVPAEQVEGAPPVQDSEDRRLAHAGRTYAIHPIRTEDGGRLDTVEDVTGQIAADRAVRDSEARLRALIDEMSDCVKIFDEAGRLIYINPAGLALHQAPDRASLPDNREFSTVAPEYRAYSGEVHRRVIGGETVLGTYEVIGLQGRRRHVEARALPFPMPDGTTAHMCISRDIEESKESLDALRRSEERLRLVQEVTGLADFESDPEGVAQLSERFVEQTGLPPGTRSITHAEWMKIVHPDDRDRMLQLIARCLDGQQAFECEFRIIRPDDGRTRWIFSRTRIERNATGEVVRSVGAHLDITERKRSEDALRESEERFRLATEAARLGVWDYDAALDQRDWSGRLREILGIGPDTEPTLELAASIVHPMDRARFLRRLKSIRLGKLERFEDSFRICRADDSADRWITVNAWRTGKTDSRLGRVIMTVRDVSEEKTAEDRIRWTARHDALTHLANRSYFHEQLDLAIRAAAADGGTVGLLLLDLDHFKQINDSLGHDAGDKMLSMFAGRLCQVVRANDVVARHGGDEFAIIMPDMPNDQSLGQLSRSIQQRLREPFVHDGRVLDCRVSMGASIFPRHGTTSEELLKNADIALYAAKAAGRSTMSLFEPHMRDDLERRIAMVETARAALRDDRIIPYYQPKIDLRTGAIVGFEALLRWRNARGRIGLPAAIEAAFEDLDVAAAISDRMIERVIPDMRGWLDRGIPFRHVAVNASAAEFRRDNFAERLLEQLSRAGIPPRCFQLEVTETVFLGRGAEYVHRALALLSQRGVQIALDDFGTGYASLRHLKEFPVDLIKIDRSFVHDMALGTGDEAIIRAVINLGQSLGIKVVAEGIESEAQARRLIELECDFGQGFLFSKAVPAARVPALAGNPRELAKARARAGGSPLRLVGNQD
ncbi:MAG: hypothetical protein B7Z08_09225 [Sphingomonadales bacterium 32-68-7]|nr:MAG: hypothetical protein B7Z33_11865 [Sphingomonadales bacterium 12-68-11]OYX08478.1 MAG: hypothetical protein B7Z08_09225 [Sphingomonadales bacterium 32-68-7]